MFKCLGTLYCFSNQSSCHEILKKLVCFIEVSTSLYLIGHRSCNASYATLVSGMLCPCRLVVPISFCSIKSGSERGYQSVSQSDAVFSQDSYVTCFCLLDSDTLWDFSLFLCPTEAHMLELRAMGVKRFWTASETGSQMQLCLFWATTWCNTT